MNAFGTVESKYGRAEAFMPMNIFASLSEPRIHVDELDKNSLRARAQIFSTAEVTVRVLRGHKMTSDARLFDEVAAAFQVPAYFGENWNALRDCLCDLEWMPAKRYVVLIASAEVMVTAAPDLLRHLVIVFNEVAQEWSQPGMRPWAPEPRPFHVVLSHAGAGRFFGRPGSMHWGRI